MSWAKLSVFCQLMILAISTRAVSVASEDDVSVCYVGVNKQLLLDDCVVDEMNGLRRVLHPARRHPTNPILVPEHLWEGKALEAPIVFWEDELGLFRMYYWAIGTDSIYTCYATSEDGISWQKPILGLHEGPDGTKQNNIVLRGEGGKARTRYVVRNPNADDPSKKYVAMYIDNVPGLTEFIAYSPDGIHWTTAIKIGDLRNVTGEPPTPNPRYFLVEQRWDAQPEHRCRAIWRTQSDDLRTWSGGTWIIRRQGDDDPNLEFYHATSHFLGEHRYGGLHLGYYYPFHTDPEGATLPDGTRMAGTIDTHLMVSRDTINWQLVDRDSPFLSIGEEGAWDAGMVFVSPEIVANDQLRFYYGAWKREHSAGAENDGAIGLATLRRDGFVSLEPEDGKGMLVTKPFAVAAGRLEVNADATGGSVLVEILDASGKPMPGYRKHDAQAISDTDNLRLRPRWNNHDDLASLVGETVRLKFYLEKARLYAFQFKP